MKVKILLVFMSQLLVASCANLGESDFFIPENATVEEYKPIIRALPIYPDELRLNGVTGWTEVEFDIDKNGRTRNIRIVDSDPKRAFDQVSRDTVRKWKYQPRKANGKPIAVKAVRSKLTF